MSFMEYPRPDACRALMPSPEPAPPGPPGRPMVCHMPEGHEGLHAITRLPRALDRRWEGDARPAAAPADTDDIDWSAHRGSCRVFYAERRCTCGVAAPADQTGTGEVCACGHDETDHGNTDVGCIHCGNCDTYVPRSTYVPATVPADTDDSREAPDAVLVDGDWVSPSREAHARDLTKSWADAAQNAGCPPAFVARMRAFVEVHDRLHAAALASPAARPAEQIPYMLADTPEEFERVRDLAWPAPAEPPGELREPFPCATRRALDGTA